MHGIIYRAGLPIAIILAWQLIASLGLVSPALLPSPAYIVETFIYLIQSGDLWRHVSSSAARVFQGYAIAATLALTLGIAMGAFPKIDRVMRLLVQILKPVPPIAWIPLAILWFGIDEGSKIFIIALGAFFPILVSTVDGIRQTDKKYVELARVLELPHHLFLTRVMLPSALPHVMTGLRLGFALAWMCVVAAELIAASSGIGFLIMDGRAVSQADLVLAGMLTLGVLGKLTDDGIQRLEKRLTGWRTDFTGLSAK
jgi:ABC-type nitrate/sulfonate/bicarbonate transport system, permease component